MLVIIQSQNGGDAEVFVGELFQVQLSENPTTGYRWYLQSASDLALRIVEDSFVTLHSGQGSQGVRQWTLMVDHPAVIALRMELKRSWQPQPIETFSVTINAKPTPGQKK